MVQVATRRDRVRAATSLEIIQTARRLLVEQGSAAISLRAIAREMGMTAPALYRYFGSHEELIENVIADVFTELSDHLQAQIAAVASEAGSAGADNAAAATGAASVAGGAGTATSPDAAEQQAAEQQAALIGAQLMAACKAFRDWALAHPPEFGMIFGSPLPGLELLHDDPLTDCGVRFGLIFVNLFNELWRLKPFAVPADDEIGASMTPQLVHYREMLGSELPIGALQTFLRCWVLLYGTVSLEVFGHLRFALADAEPMFEMVLTDMAPMIGLEYPQPA